MIPTISIQSLYTIFICIRKKPMGICPTSTFKNSSINLINILDLMAFIQNQSLFPFFKILNYKTKTFFGSNDMFLKQLFGSKINTMIGFLKRFRKIILQ